MDVRFKPENISIIDIQLIKPNNWNPKDLDTPEYQKIVQGIRLKGQRLPIVVREIGDTFEIVDGEQRYRACLDLAFEKILIYNEGKITDQEAKELTIWYQQQVPFNEVSLAKLIKDLSCCVGFSKDNFDNT